MRTHREIYREEIERMGRKGGRKEERDKNGGSETRHRGAHKTSFIHACS
jgi:hypothetical protein